MTISGLAINKNIINIPWRDSLHGILSSFLDF